jgi:glucose/mannose-6-phosphate isomerase
LAKVNLNDAAAIRAHDSLRMLDVQADYHVQFREAASLAGAFALPPRPARVDEVVILGTGGGSAASGNLLRSYLFRDGKVPIHVVQGYHAPGFVDANSIVIACSHSGKTEEINASAREAAERGAMLVGMGAGGMLKETVTRLGFPYLDLPLYNPKVDGQVVVMPRVCIGYIMVPTLLMLERWALVPEQGGALAEATRLLAELGRRYAPEVPVEENLAKKATLTLADLVPVVYGFSDHYDGVAWRIKNQLGENSKYMAFWNTIPHLHHDEAVGWDMQPELMRGLGFLLLRDRQAESEQMLKRWRATREILEERAGACMEVWAEGESLLARMLSLVVLGDFVSCYLAIEKGVDPTPVAIIDLFKQKVGQQR